MANATIGSALVERRGELGLEKGQAAAKIGMSRTTYSSYEQDAQRPSAEVLPAIAEFLSISMEEILTLYGASCVSAMRASLEKVGSNEAASNGSRPLSSLSSVSTETVAGPDESSLSDRAINGSENPSGTASSEDAANVEDSPPVQSTDRQVTPEPAPANPIQSDSSLKRGSMAPGDMKKDHKGKKKKNKKKK